MTLMVCFNSSPSRMSSFDTFLFSALQLHSKTWWQGEITKYAAIGWQYLLEAGESPDNWPNAEIQSGVSGIFPQISALLSD